MNSQLKYKVLQFLNNKKKEQGFTLIELLVVIIIIGVLSAVALPNLLNQVGKARESEFKTAVGTINRAQQTYHFEKQTFAQEGTVSNGQLPSLGITLATEYTDKVTVSGNDDTATVQIENSSSAEDGTRAYSGAIAHSAGQFAQVMCQSDAVTDVISAPDVSSGAGFEPTAVCDAVSATAVR